MKLVELIEALKSFPPDWPVLVESQTFDCLDSEFSDVMAIKRENMHDGNAVVLEVSRQELP